MKITYIHKNPQYFESVGKYFGQNGRHLQPPIFQCFSSPCALRGLRPEFEIRRFGSLQFCCQPQGLSRNSTVNNCVNRIVRNKFSEIQSHSEPQNATQIPSKTQIQKKNEKYTKFGDFRIFFVFLLSSGKNLGWIWGFGDFFLIVWGGVWSQTKNLLRCLCLKLSFLLWDCFSRPSKNRGFAKGPVSKRVVGGCSWTPKTGTRLQEPERAYKNQCSWILQNRNKDTRNWTTIEKSGDVHGVSVPKI